MDFLTLDELITRLTELRDQYGELAGELAGADLVAVDHPLSDLLYISGVEEQWPGRVHIIAEEIDRT